MKNQFFNPKNYSRQRVIHQAIKKPVITEHESQLVQAVRWRKYWVKWKIRMITEIRYRGIFFLGTSTELP